MRGRDDRTPVEIVVMVKTVVIPAEKIHEKIEDMPNALPNATRALVAS